MNTQLNEMVLRADRPTDEAALRRLAALDSARPLRGRALVAEVEGRAIAALALSDGRVVADPFEHTAEVVELLRARAEREATYEPRQSRAARFVDRLRIAA
jgi:hypothetical protein